MLRYPVQPWEYERAILWLFEINQSCLPVHIVKYFLFRCLTVFRIYLRHSEQFFNKLSVLWILKWADINGKRHRTVVSTNDYYKLFLYLEWKKINVHLHTA